MNTTKLLTNEKALELTEKLLQNDKNIRDALREEKADTTYVDEKIASLENEIEINKSTSDTSVSALDAKINDTIIETDEKIASAKTEINGIIDTNKTETDTNIANINLAISALETELEENTTELSDAISAETTRVNTELNNKVDKIIGKDLSTNDLTNELKASYDSAVTNEHTHANKLVIDGITSEDIASWNDKATTSYVDEVSTALSGRISVIEDDYVKQIDIPTNVSELINDSNYQTAVDVNVTLATALLPYAKSADVTTEISAEIAKIVAEAPESFDTLKELSDWISNHETDAAAMNSAIQENKSNIVALENNKVDKIAGMGLSTNDYTTDEKIKLAGLSNYNDSLLIGKISSLENEMSDLKSNIASVDEINDYLFGEEE